MAGDGESGSGTRSAEPVYLSVVNDHSQCEATYLASKDYLGKHPALHKRIALYLRAQNEIGDLVPQTPTNLMSGHYFPYVESRYHLESSYELALQGFYSYSLFALRSSFELGLLLPYFAVQDTEHLDVQPWITAAQRTPQRKEIFSRLRTLKGFAAFDRNFGLVTRIRETFEKLDSFVHTRGARHSASSLARSNINQFLEPSLRLYAELLESVVRDSVIVMLLKYPVGLQKLPIVQRCGMNGPAGGFLEPHQVTLIASLVEGEERAFLQRLSDEDPDVQRIVAYFEGLPDLSKEDWDKQLEDWERRHPEIGKSD